MSMTDPIADLLTRIRNAIQARHDKVDLLASRIKTELVRILKEEGYVRNYKVLENRFSGILRVYLKYDAAGDSVIAGIQRASRPGMRLYCRAGEVPEALGGLGIAVVSTSKGLMSGDEAARQRIGGEVLCHVW